MEKSIVSWKNVFIYAGAFIAFLIGSGFATGQEILQYFASYGYRGILGSLVVFILFLYVGMDFIAVGQREQFEKGNDIYKYYGGKYIGAFYDYFSIIFIYMSFFVMVAGVGATINQHYGLPVAVGGVGLAVCAGVTVMFGLKNVVSIIGRIGPLIIILAIFLGIISIFKNPAGIAEGHDLVPNLNLLKASTNWFFAAFSYVGFCMLWLASFMASMGKTARSQKEAKLGGVLGAVGFSLAVIIITLALLANIQQVAGTMIPSLYLAGNIHPYLATGFSGIIVLGIYSTAVPLLWSVSSRFANDGTKKFKVLTLVLAAIGAFVGLEIPFDELVNFVYVINGYVGIFLLVLMIIKSIQRIAKNKAI